jgi:hypothetical protein
MNAVAAASRHARKTAQTDIRSTAGRKSTSTRAESHAKPSNPSITSAAQGPAAGDSADARKVTTRRTREKCHASNPAVQTSPGKLEKSSQDLPQSEELSRQARVALWFGIENLKANDDVVERRSAPEEILPQRMRSRNQETVPRFFLSCGWDAHFEQVYLMSSVPKLGDGRNNFRIRAVIMTHIRQFRRDITNVFLHICEQAWTREIRFCCRLRPSE